MRVLTCPQCSVAMKPFFAVAGQGAPVELDRCGSCGRFWFDGGELERAAQRPFMSRLPAGPGGAPCLACQGPTRNVLVSGEIAVEECESCQGMLLEPRDVEQVSGKPIVEAKPPAPPQKHKAPPPPSNAGWVAKPKPSWPPKAPPAAKPTRDLFLTFNCERCRKEVQTKNPQQVNGAFVCSTCEALPWPDQPTWENARGRRGELLIEILESLFD